MISKKELQDTAYKAENDRKHKEAILLFDLDKLFAFFKQAACEGKFQATFKLEDYMISLIESYRMSAQSTYNSDRDYAYCVLKMYLMHYANLELYPVSKGEYCVNWGYK